MIGLNILENMLHDCKKDPHERPLLALHYHRFDEFKHCLKELPSPAVLDEQKENLLHRCARLCDVGAITVLLKLKPGPDVNGQNVRGQTPLHVALESLATENGTMARRAEEVVKLLMYKAKADLFISDENGDTPFGIAGRMTNCPAKVVLKMYYSAKRGCPDIAKFMVDHGWRLPAVFHMNNVVLTNRMIELCPELLKPSNNGKKPNELLHLAVEADCGVDILAMLLRIGKLDVNAIYNGRTPLHVAAERNFRATHYKQIKFLLHQNANPKLTNNRGMRAIHYTVRHGNAEVFELLVAAESQMPRDAVQPWMPHGIFLAAYNGCISIIRHLLTEDNINSKCYRGMTPLHYAAREKNATAVYYLLAAGADVNAVDNRGWSALHHAVHAEEKKQMYGSAVPVIGLLLHFGADVEQINSDQRSPLYIALEQENDSAVKQLVRHAALKVDRSKRTANQILIETSGELYELYKRCLQELTYLFENGATNGVNYLPMLRFTREELILVACGLKEVTYVCFDHECCVKFNSKNFSPGDFPIYGNFLVNRIHHANLELMTLEEVGGVNDFNLKSDILAESAGEFVEFFQDKYLL